MIERFEGVTIQSCLGPLYSNFDTRISDELRSHVNNFFFQLGITYEISFSFNDNPNKDNGLEVVAITKMNYKEFIHFVRIVSQNISDATIFITQDYDDNWIESYGTYPYSAEMNLGNDMDGLVIQVYLTIMFDSKELFYRDYLKSNKWRLRKNIIFKNRGFSCELCASKKNIQVHHLSYKNLGNEKDEDLMILCGICHSNAHTP